MKNPLLIAALSCLLFAPAFAAVADSSTGGGGQTSGDVGDADAASKKKKVKPGECHTNNDGVEVCNDSGSSGNATIDPKDGSAASATTVTTKTGFEGKVTNMDGNDTVDVASNNDVTISGDGGTVNMGGGSTANISNTSGPGGASTTVNMPSGATLTIGPGSSLTITT